MSAAALLAVVLAASPAPITAARTHLREGKLDEVLFDLQGQKFDGAADKKAAAEVLAQTAQKCFAANDDLMALQLAQMALTHDKAQAVANEIAARASLKQQQFADAEAYADAWLSSAKSGEARLFRAQLALDQADWDKAIAVLKEGTFTGDEAVKAELLRKKAQGEKRAQLGAMREVKTLEATVDLAAREAKTLPPDTKPVGTGEVVVYSTAWCGYCQQAVAWFRRKKVPFVQKDVEKDPTAKPEIEKKLAERKETWGGGVPLIDAGGTFIFGFDKKKLEAIYGR